MAEAGRERRRDRVSGDKDAEKVNSYLLLVGMQNGTASLENNLVVSMKLNRHIAYDPESPLFLAKHKQKLCLHKSLNVNVDRVFFLLA
jgi:hypothetical protein